MRQVSSRPCSAHSQQNVFAQMLTSEAVALISLTLTASLQLHAFSTRLAIQVQFGIWGMKVLMLYQARQIL